MKWIRCIDQMPEIPPDKNGVAVLVASFDPCYDECCPGKGYDIHCISYCYVNYKHMPYFEGSRIADGEPCFVEIGISSKEKNGYEYLPPCDEITHWMYLPEPPEYEAEVLNPIFLWYHNNAVPQSELKEI